MRIARRLALISLGLLIGTIFMALLAEIGLRIRTAYFNHLSLVTLTKNPPAKSEVVDGDIVRFLDNPRLVYAPRPNLDVIFRGQPLKTNAEGFRDTDHTVEKPPHKRRVLFIGDSTLFGWTMAVEKRYTNLLVEKMPDWDVMNMSMGGWNAAQEIECLRVYGLKYHPDLVIVNYVANDAQLPNYIQRSPTDTSASFLIDWLHGRLHRETLLPPQMQPAWKPGVVYLDDDPNRVPDQYRDIVGWEAVQRAYKELSELGKEHGFKTAVLGFPGGDDHARQFAEDASIPYWDFQPITSRLMTERNIKEYMGSVLAVTPTDAHPGPIMHAACAEFLVEHIRKEFTSSSDTSR